MLELLRIILDIFRRLWFSFPPRDEVPPTQKRNGLYYKRAIAAQGGDIYDLIQSPSYITYAHTLPPPPPARTLYSSYIFRDTRFILSSSSCSTAWRLTRKTDTPNAISPPPPPPAGRRRKRR